MVRWQCSLGLYFWYLGIFVAVIVLSVAVVAPAKSFIELKLNSRELQSSVAIFHYSLPLYACASLFQLTQRHLAIGYSDKDKFKTANHKRNGSMCFILRRVWEIDTRIAICFTWIRGKRTFTSKSGRWTWLSWLAKATKDQDQRLFGRRFPNRESPSISLTATDKAKRITFREALSSLCFKQFASRRFFFVALPFLLDFPPNWASICNLWDSARGHLTHFVARRTIEMERGEERDQELFAPFKSFLRSTILYDC